MPEATEQRSKTPQTFLILAGLLIANTLVFGQAGRGGGGQGGGGAAPAGAPAAGAPAPAGGPAAAAPAQGRGGAAPGAAAGGRGTAPVDLTGTWVSIVTEDWIERMSPDSPPSGVPRGGRGGGGGGAGRGGAPAAAPGAEPCRVYAAGGFMRVPGRLNISWVDDNTLKVDLDAGTQSRLFRFNTTVPPGTPKSLQGYSIATWEVGGGGGRGGGRGGGGGAAAPAAPRWGSLRVVTTNLSGGYLLSSRNSYSENATLTEHFTRHSDFGQEYFTVTAVVEDQAGGGGRGGALSTTSSTFKKEPNNSKFAPAGCEIVR